NVCLNKIVPLEKIVFRNYSDFNNAPTPENNGLWMDLLGPGMGFISIENPSKYGLPPGVRLRHSPPNMQNFGISMYHQLHCLMMIRGLYWEALRGERNLKMISDEKLPDDIHHTNHCFDYLRQAIMCAGDMSIEGRAPPDHITQDHINGMGQKHICRSWDASRAWMDNHLPLV
ncbi:hypothetical protein PVAG01_06170, partial [Phlyctema vagabunda]